jgi:hypothetical protein
LGLTSGFWVNLTFSDECFDYLSLFLANFASFLKEFQPFLLAFSQYVYINMSKNNIQTKDIYANAMITFLFYEAKT